LGRPIGCLTLAGNAGSAEVEEEIGGSTGMNVLTSSRCLFAASDDRRSAPDSKVGTVFITAASWASKDGTPTSNVSSAASSSMLNKLAQLLALLELHVDDGMSATFNDAFFTLFCSGLVCDVSLPRFNTLPWT